MICDFGLFYFNNIVNVWFLSAFLFYRSCAYDFKKSAEVWSRTTKLEWFIRSLLKQIHMVKALWLVIQFSMWSKDDRCSFICMLIIGFYWFLWITFCFNKYLWISRILWWYELFWHLKNVSLCQSIIWTIIFTIMIIN